jgi:(p)ppGpp synthase/HD superfamily hydrolase
LKPTTWSPDLLTRAYWFAANAHQGGKIKGTALPYIVHPSLVALEVMAALRAEPGYDEELAVQCAILHDVIEDTPVTLEELRANFGDGVAEGVQALSKDERLPEDDQLADSLRRIQQQPPEIWMVKLADRIANLRPPPADWTAEKIRRYWEDAKGIYALLHSASPQLAQRLAEKIEAYRIYLQQAGEESHECISG